MKNLYFAKTLMDWEREVESIRAARMSKNQITPKAWIGVLSKVFENDISQKLDSVFIDFENLNKALWKLEKRSVFVLNAYFSGEGSLSEIGKMTFNRTCGKTGIGHERIRQIIIKSIRQLRHPINAEFIKTSITAWWNLLPEKKGLENFNR
jgi:DNA-directed RNA polymerase sigma subunit (sigma70/sigma32)